MSPNAGVKKRTSAARRGTRSAASAPPLPAKPPAFEQAAPAPADSQGFIEGLDSFDALALVEISRADRYQAPLSLLLVEWNASRPAVHQETEEQRDHYLHQLGQLVQNKFRVSDRLGRWGDRGLAVLLPETGLQSAERVADRLLKAGQQDHFLASARLSIGIASHRPGEPLDLLVARAESALVQAQKAKTSQALASLEDLEHDFLTVARGSKPRLPGEDASPPLPHAPLGHNRVRLSRLMVQIAAQEAEGAVPATFLAELLVLLAAYLESEEKALETVRPRGTHDAAAYHALQDRVSLMLDEAGMPVSLSIQGQADEPAAGGRRFQDDCKYFGSSDPPRRR